MRTEAALEQLNSKIGQGLAEVARLTINADPEQQQRLDTIRIGLQMLRSLVTATSDALRPDARRYH
jgi:signal transduction histidine kinase